MSSLSKKVSFADYVFHVYENVYEPAEDSFLFAENLRVRREDCILDMGTGCGILGIIGAEKAAEVFAVDVNPYAVRCAKENAELNGVLAKMFFIEGDLFTPIRTGKKFDLILFNTPYVPTEPAEDVSWLGRSWGGGVNGRQVIDRFIHDAPDHLTQCGRIFLMQSTLSRVDETSKRFRRSGLKTRIVAEHALPFFETIELLKAEFR